MDVSTMLGAVLGAAAKAAEDDSRGKLLWRVNGRECRLHAADTMVITGPGGVFTHHLEGVDIEAVL